MGINRHKGTKETLRILDWYWVIHDKMWIGFVRVATRVTDVQGGLSIEWSHRCAFHRLSKTRKFVHKFGMEYCPVSGCAVGLKSIESSTLGKPLCKVWGFWCNQTNLINALKQPNMQCNKKHESIPTTGTNTAHSGNYTNQLAKIIHQAIKPTPSRADRQQESKSG